MCSPMRFFYRLNYLREKADLEYKNGWEMTYLIGSCMGAKLKPLPWTKEHMSVEDWREFNKMANSIPFKEGKGRKPVTREEIERTINGQRN